METHAPPPRTAREWVGRNLRQLRTERGLTLDQLADLVTARGFTMDKSQLSKIENGRSNVDVEKLLAFADALDVVPDRLLRDPENLDAALLNRLYRAWLDALREAQKNQAIANALLSLVIKAGSRLPESNATLNQFQAEMMRRANAVRWVQVGDEVAPHEPGFDVYVADVISGRAFEWSDEAAEPVKEKRNG